MQQTPYPRLLGIPCWIFPLLAGLTWLVALLAILAEWIAKGSPHYPEMLPSQVLAYISNAGASDWGRPLFIAGSTITALLFSITFVSEKLMRRRGRLLHTSNRWATGYWTAAAVLTFIAVCAQILFTVFCVREHALVHYTMVAIFALGYIFAAALTCAEKWIICKAFPTSKILRYSLYVKSFFIAIELVLVVVGSVTMFQSMYRASVLVEWTAAILFSFYMSSFAIDFLAVPNSSEGADEVDAKTKAWDAEIGLSRPRRYTLRHRDYLELP